MSLLSQRKRKLKPVVWPEKPIEPKQEVVADNSQRPLIPVLDDRIIRNIKPDWELSIITGLKKSSIYKQEILGTFPKRIKITGRSSGWRLSEVKQWIEGKRDWGAKV